ncbi:MAG: MarR family transcriptional regulator [Eubacteriaceae bacterium]
MKKDKKTKKNNSKDNKESKKDGKKKLSENKQVSPTPSKRIKKSLPEGDHLGELKELMIHCSTLYQNILMLPINFNGELLLYPSEMKALEVIGTTPEINLTQLAKKLNISKSAVSKCTSKLLEKRMITKERSLTNVREVIFMLSENGQLIYSQRSSYQDAYLKPLNDSLQSLTSEETMLLTSLFTTLLGNLEKSKNKF